MKIKKIILFVLSFTLLTLSLEAKNRKINKAYLGYYIEATAKSKLGKKYKWGGDGPYAYDCSGFTKAVFALNGIKIPRNSWKQAQIGMKVSRKHLRRGDLIFFSSKDHKGINHVGIYIGHGKFIHASRFHKRIVISPLREYRRYFKWGCRVS